MRMMRFMLRCLCKWWAFTYQGHIVSSVKVTCDSYIVSHVFIDGDQLQHAESEIICIVTLQRRKSPGIK